VHCGPRPRGYVPRATQQSDAVAVVRAHLPAFVERLEQETGATLPAFVLDELQAFTSCGDFEHGFIRVLCQRRGDETRVPLSCKARGVCPSCTGRRMTTDGCFDASNGNESPPSLHPPMPFGSLPAR
jgi:hypothetical protein